MIKESFRNVSCFFVFGYLQVFLREVIALASLDAFAESSVAMKHAMVLSGMSHVMVKLFAPWVSWRVFPYSDIPHPHHVLLRLYVCNLGQVLASNSTCFLMLITILLAINTYSCP